MRQQNQELTHVKHEFDPIFDENSEILILGTLPSVKSREQNFYYGHPQNRFWKVIAALFCEPVPEKIPEKKDLLLKHHIALWDVIAECDIAGSSDSSIKNVVPAELSVILDHAPIRTIYAMVRKHMTCIKSILIRSLAGTSENFPPQVRRMRRSRWRGCLGRGRRFWKNIRYKWRYYHAHRQRRYAGTDQKNDDSKKLF